MHLPDISSGTLIQGLRFLYDLYKDRRDRKKNEGNDPDPEKLEELIKELQLKAQHGEPSKEEISNQMVRKLGTQVAGRVIQQISDVIFPQCQCLGCGSEKHKNRQCTASANEPGTIFCTSCQTARSKDAKGSSAA